MRVTDIEPGLVGGTEFSMSALKAMTVKWKKPIKIPLHDARRCQRSRLVGVNAACSRHINTLEMMPVTQSYAGLNVHLSNFYTRRNCRVIACHKKVVTHAVNSLTSKNE